MPAQPLPSACPRGCIFAWAAVVTLACSRGAAMDRSRANRRNLTMDPSSTRIQSWVKFGKAHPFIPDLRASASLGPCNLRNSLESSVPGYPGRGPSGSDPGQASDLALAPVPPQVSAPVLGRHAAGVLVAAPAQGLASALAPKDASPVASGVGGPLGRPSSDHGSPVCSTGLWSPPPS